MDLVLIHLVNESFERTMQLECFYCRLWDFWWGKSWTGRQ